MVETFPSILFETADESPSTRGAGGAGSTETHDPDYFTDLNLDQLFEVVTEDRPGYDLLPLYRRRLRTADAVLYRQEVFRDLENPALAEGVKAFAERMRETRARLRQGARLRHRYQQQSWLLRSVDSYRQAVSHLVQTLKEADLGSRGLRAFRDHLVEYERGTAYTTLLEETATTQERLTAVRYCLTITGGKVKVTRYDDEPDYGAEVVAGFEKFSQGQTQDHSVRFREPVELNSVEAAVLDRVALLFPEEFQELDAYAERHGDFVAEAIATFDREAQFYLAYLDTLVPLKEAALDFCYPRMMAGATTVEGQGVFDVVLADRLARTRTTVVPNDFRLEAPERILVVSGPNQGGKTTFARTIGQLHHLAALGCPVPGREAGLLMCDAVFTHFERGENLKDLSGKLKDDLVRIHDILERVTENSIVIMNEVFTSTTLHDAVDLGTKVLRQVIDAGALGVCVTFVDELSELGPATVSMVSTVVPDDPARRTFRIVRKPADGLSYALAVADKYGLTHDKLAERIKRLDASDGSSSRPAKDKS
ncbi:hypothetical protein K7472_31065 [Streptomyces sp. PTM05]|uniref:DNA mismatch repair proteins mutS family domain-containing protein n=1 Tax=Streptantibioticus parmotrematis TaxID=2873249 RepID=A0ABS7R1B5_9ACTN|nr:hypothetical protein [Streptantibioticus parmotrematis]MBY8889251.1 hypothetical protein [Streptantibioticus parmotrematis]